MAENGEFHTPPAQLVHKALSEETLRQSLLLFDNIFKETGYACIEYQIMAYTESNWEDWVKENLTKIKIVFNFKPAKFHLPGNIFYTLDFVLKRNKINGRQIVLEPHGKMKEEDVHKFSIFKQLYSKEYFLLLVIRNDDIFRFRQLNLLPEKAYDDVWPIEDLGELLRRIKHNQYNPLISSVTN